MLEDCEYRTFCFIIKAVHKEKLERTGTMEIQELLQKVKNNEISAGCRAIFKDTSI